MLQEMAPSWRSSPRYQAQYFTEKGLALFGVGRLQEAAISLSQAIQVTEILRGKVTGERAGFLQTGRYGGNIRPYQSLVVVLIQMAFQSKDLPKELKQYGPDPGAAAFYFAESTKARSLLEAMTQEGLRHFDPQIPPDLAKREQDLRDRLGALEGPMGKTLYPGRRGGEAFPATAGNTAGRTGPAGCRTSKGIPPLCRPEISPAFEAPGDSLAEGRGSAGVRFRGQKLLPLPSGTGRGYPGF